MNIENYDIEPQGDGTLLLTPKTDSDEDFIQRYRALLERIVAVEAYRTKAELQLATLNEKRTTARQALEARGINPDAI